jgi:uncharacterized protein (DUF885 family)
MKYSVPTRVASFRSLLVTALFACARADEEAMPGGRSEALHAFFDRFTADWVRTDPDLAVATRFLQGDEQAALERRLTPRTREWKLERIELARRGLAELARFDPAALSDEDRVSADVMRSQLQTIVDGEPFLDFELPLNQMNGANVEIPNALTVSHPVLEPADAERYVARLAEVDDRMREATAESAYQAELGIVPPRFIVQATIDQMERFVAYPAGENPLVTTLANKMRDVTGLDEETRTRLTAQATRIVEQEVYPAWRDAVAVLRRQLPIAGEEAGISRLPRGLQAYAYALRRFTTTDLTADRIHEIGLREVARIEAEMDSLFRLVGLSEGTIKERGDRLRERLAYPVNDEGRRQIMADIQSMLADALVRSRALFDVMPRARVVAQPYPEFRWDNAAASYTAPLPDGSRPGIFQMPLRADELTRYELRSLVYHETVPGHHFQIALAVENENLPAFRQLRVFGTISATVEGWALYAERLALEQGWYEGDIEGMIGALESQLFRARRLVVDTGLHTRGWTREQAIAYGIAPSEVDRYVAWPGQACAYTVGQLKLVELRERARAALGERFSLRAYHNVVLGLGSVPLDVLEREVDRWIASQ